VTFFRYRIVLLLFLLSCAGAAAGVTGKITGRVINAATNEPLPFASILVAGTSLGAASDIDGYYTILNVSPGVFTVKASSVGYSTVAVQNVKVSIDLTSTIDFRLKETSVDLGQEVVIVAERPMVTKDLTASTSVIGADNIAVLPVTEFQEVLQLQAGMVGGNVRGGRKGEIVYAIDGVPMTDVFDGSTIVDVNANSIEELQFVSGAFNAEYGRALSAYVNIATKDGGEKFTGVLTGYAGDYASSHADIFRGIDRVSPTAIRNGEGSLSGPILKNLLSFYLNGRYNYTDGWFYGKRVYHPWDITINKGPNDPLESRYIIQQTGDGEYVPLNWNEKLSLQGKLTYHPFSTVKLTYNYIFEKVRYQDYDHSFSYNPDGEVKRFRNANTNSLGLTHTVSAVTFYQTSISYFFKEYKHSVYESVNDPLYTNYMLLNQQPQETPSFRTGGTDNQHYRRSTGTIAFKYDISSQLAQQHQLKAGIDISRHELSFETINLLQADGLPDPAVSLNPFVKMRVPDPANPGENLSIDRYIRNPIEMSAYVQDKIELKDLIINIGLRLDYFDPDGKILSDITDPDIYRPLRPENIAASFEQRKASWYTKASKKIQLSPRLGVAFPITDRGVIHFSYGHFFQIPNFDYLYQNPEFKFGAGVGNLGIAGNADLRPEQTVNGEVGVQQAITDDISIDLTGYFRDIRNLTGTRADEINLFGGAGRYSQFVNSDFGFVRGIVLTVSKRFSGGWAATVDYTLQTAKGNASDPAATRNQLVSGQQPEVQLIALNWDQRHTLNVTFSYTADAHWGFSAITQYGSGFPYTPTQSMNISDLLTNSEFKQPTLNVDAKLYKDFYVGDLRLSLFARINNLFDIKNQVNVYNDSGTADFTLDEYLRKRQGLPAVVNTVDEYYTNPTFYSEPRRVEIGASIFF
jgi:outer membrane receptor for ferrienterochelin and colicin